MVAVISYTFVFGCLVFCKETLPSIYIFTLVTYAVLVRHFLPKISDIMYMKTCFVNLFNMMLKVTSVVRPKAELVTVINND